MPRQIRYDDGVSPAGGRAPAGCLTRLAALAGAPFVMAAVLYAAVLAMSRSPVFRAYLADAFSVRCGLDFTLRSASIAPNLDIVVTGLSATSRAARAGSELAADRMRLAWSWRRTEPDGRLRGLEVAGGRAAWAPEAGGGWSPTGLPGRVAAWMAAVYGLPGSAAAASPVGIGLDLRDCSSVWRNTEGAVAMEASGVHLRTSPLKAPERRLVHVSATAERLRRADGSTEGPVSLECVFVDGERIELGPRPGRSGAAAAARP